PPNHARQHEADEPIARPRAYDAEFPLLVAAAPSRLDHLFGARAAVGLEPRERLLGRLQVIAQMSREDHRVLERHRRALSRMRADRMRGIADQADAPAM